MKQKEIAKLSNDTSELAEHLMQAGNLRVDASRAERIECLKVAGRLMVAGMTQNTIADLIKAVQET